ncbi:hypothetical protein ACWFRF_20675 [Nocardia sp. NPDC055165]
MSSPVSMPRDAAEVLIVAAIRNRCAVVLIGNDPADPDALCAQEIHNERNVDDALLARALRDLADRIDARHASPGG